MMIVPDKEKRRKKEWWKSKQGWWGFRVIIDPQLRTYFYLKSPSNRKPIGNF